MKMTIQQKLEDYVEATPEAKLYEAKIETEVVVEDKGQLQTPPCEANEEEDVL